MMMSIFKNKPTSKIYRKSVKIKLYPKNKNSMRLKPSNLKMLKMLRIIKIMIAIFREKIIN